MPMLDLPLEKLRVYQGTNPCPADHAAYWDRALAAQRATDPAPELRPAVFPGTREVECLDLTFTGVGGARIYAKYARPRGSTARYPAVLRFHGYSCASEEWTELMAYAANGVCIAVMDCRGQGGRSEDVGGVKGTTLRGHIIRGLDDHPDQLLYRQHFLDTVQLARVVSERPEVDADCLGCYGGSQGGGLALACAALEPRIKRCASVYPFLCDYRRVWDMDLCKDAYDEIRYFLRWFDPRHERVAEIFTRLGYIDVQHLAPRIQGEVLMFSALMDSICPPSTQFAAYNKIKAPKDVVIYPDFGHEYLHGSTDRIFTFLQGLRA